MLFRRKTPKMTVLLEPPPPRGRDLPAELLRKLEFKVLKRLDGFLFGDYSGFFYGPSLDLAEVREYQPGDEVRRIDWNVTARSGKIHVRQYREEREVTAWLIVDLTASMNFGTRRVLKREEALEFAATAAAIITRHGDKVGAIGFSEAGLRIIPPSSGRKQTLRILHELYALAAKGNGKKAGSKSQFSQPPAPSPHSSGDLSSALEYASKTLKRRALMFVVSDFLAEAAPTPSWVLALRRLAYKHEVVAVRVSDPAERELPKAGELRLRDPESGEEVWVDTSDPRVRAAYAQLVEQREAWLERDFRAAQVEMLPLSTDQDIVAPILKFTLRRRNRR